MDLGDEVLIPLRDVPSTDPNKLYATVPGYISAINYGKNGGRDIMSIEVQVATPTGRLLTITFDRHSGCLPHMRDLIRV